ncbi:MAG: NADH-quinone oxidoreductase subunit C [Chloroflexota bacterium]
MEDKLSTALEALRGRFEVQVNTFRGETIVNVKSEDIVGVCRALREEFGFCMLTDETAIDYWPQQTPRFHIVYHLISMMKERLRLLVPLDGNSPSLSTVEGVFPNANWLEREIWDLFGITFEQHSDLRRIIMPRDWEGHPLRKDYPLGYEEVQFTFNSQEIDTRKPYAKE